MRKSRSCAGVLGNSRRIVIAGAGSVGCFVGGLLAVAGHEVTLLARPRIANEIRAHGLSLTSFDGMARRVDPDQLTLTDKTTCLQDADIVLVTVKSRDTALMARIIAANARPDACVISLQNGVENAEILRAALPRAELRAGLVSFTVLPMGQGGFHRASGGDIIIETGAGAVAELPGLPHLKLAETPELTRLQWGQFLIHLNDALNALSGLTLQQQLRDRAWRKLLADQWDEAMRVLKTHGIKPLLPTRWRAALGPAVLRLPGPVFARAAAAMLRIDTPARSAMSYDLIAKRKTEIDQLQGQVVRLGAARGFATPISAMVVEIVQLAETAKQGLPDLPVRALRRAI